MSAVTMGNKFPAKVSEEIFNKVVGHSTIAKLAQQMPVAFTGNKVFTFSMSNDISIVAEGGNKPAGDFEVAPVSIQPIKVVYQGRVTDEFMNASDEDRLNIMQTWLEAAARKFGAGLDKMAMHGVNPATGTSSALITSYLDQAQSISATIDPEADLADAIAALGDNELTGIAVSRTYAADLAKVKSNGVPQFPEFRLGGKPDYLNGIPCDVNSTVGTTDKAIVGDFANAFRWGYAKDLDFEVIEYGDPDGAGDLKRTNEVCLRAEAYIGFGVLNSAAFARIA